MDERGRGASGIRVAARWQYDGSKWLPGRGKPDGSTYPTALTDENGSFALYLAGGRSTVIMAMDAQGVRGAVAEANAEGHESVILRLQPLAPVRAVFVSSVTRRQVPLAWSLHLTQFGPRIADGRSENGCIEFPLPRARYHLHVESEGHQTISVRLRVGKRGAAPGEIALEPTMLAKLRGQAAPEIHVTSAFGLPEDVSLASLHGKWILIDYWGYWCGPCLAGMPELIDFWEDHAHRRSQFEILAFHDATVDSLEELQTMLVPVPKERWNGRALPFPVLMDSTGTTLERYGITSFPTLVLIDPEGRIVDSTTGDAPRILRRLADELR